MRLQAQDYSYVIVQFVLFGAFLVELEALQLVFPFWLPIIGIALACAGVLLGTIAVLQLNTQLSPFPTPKEHSALITSGVFGLVRHPIYGGILLGLLGLSLYWESGYKLGIVVLLLVLFYFKSSYEERRLAAVFEEYEQYKKRTKRFVPFVF